MPVELQVLVPALRLAEGNTLYIIGSGDGVNTTVTAKGGKAANGSNGGNGGNADFVYDSWMTSGTVVKVATAVAVLAQALAHAVAMAVLVATAVKVTIIQQTGKRMMAETVIMALTAILRKTWANSLLTRLLASL